MISENLIELKPVKISGDLLAELKTILSAPTEFCCGWDCVGCVNNNRGICKVGGCARWIKTS